MRALLDTHAFLWFVLDDRQLSVAAKVILSDPDNELLLSPASYWEIAIKVRLGKYHVPESFQDFMTDQIVRNQLVVLPITVAHTAIVATMPMHHRDPFDRLLIAQATSENVPVVSGDSIIDAYGVKRLW